jgi:hypothetical protein
VEQGKRKIASSLSRQAAFAGTAVKFSYAIYTKPGGQSGKLCFTADTSSRGTPQNLTMQKLLLKRQ